MGYQLHMMDLLRCELFFRHMTCTENANIEIKVKYRKNYGICQKNTRKFNIFFIARWGNSNYND